MCLRVINWSSLVFTDIDNVPLMTLINTKTNMFLILILFIIDPCCSQLLAGIWGSKRSVYAFCVYQPLQNCLQKGHLVLISKYGMLRLVTHFFHFLVSKSKGICMTSFMNVPSDEFWALVQKHFCWNSSDLFSLKWLNGKVGFENWAAWILPLVAALDTQWTDACLEIN